MKSGDGQAACGSLQNRAHCAYFTWCEYQDPNHLCDNDPQCFANARANGYAIGISSNTDLNGAEVGGTGTPIGCSRTNSYDDGRSAGQGLSWCLPIADLPQGLTAGMAYLSPGGDRGPIVTGGKAMGAVTPAVNGDGFAVRSDGDGIITQYGFYHQELVSGGTSDPTLSTRFKLLPGTACGFHHTKNSPGLTRMDVDPATGNCPAGWIARSQFDMSSGDGHAQCGNLQHLDHCAYFVWCEYQDTNGLCAGDLSNCQQNAEFIGYDVRIASNVEASGFPVASVACPNNNIPCHCGCTPSPNFDAGRSSGQGLAWCIPP